MKTTETILDYSISTLRLPDCIEQITDWLDQSDSPRFFACANPHSIQVAESDDLFKQALQGADLLTPDGVGIVLASRQLGGSIRERVTGSDVFAGLHAAINERGGYSVFFLGSTEEVLEDIKLKMSADYTGITVAGTYSPPYKERFSEEDNREMIRAINAVKPDVLWVGMTAPKQEKWVHQHRDQLDVKFIGAVGAVFDFYVGRVKRSHPVFQKMGLEWLPRLVQEPKRLWRRNFVSNPAFMFRVLKERLKGKG